MPRKKRARKSPARNNALDGIRALAIIAIVCYHLSAPWLPSGHIGVVVFLVLAGYLASSMLLRALHREEHVSLPRLWLKRATRIWPPMAVMIVFTVALCVVFNHILLTKLKPDLLPSLAFCNNLAAIFRGASYFDKLGGVSPLTHLWYLGIDMQFFIVWTAIVWFLCPNGRSTRICRRTCLVLALVSAVLMAVLYNPNADPTRVYYGPDTRAFAPLLGGWLGLAWPLGGRPVRLDRARHTVRSVPVALIAPFALVGLIVMMVLVPDTSAFLFRGGMLLAAILSVLVIAGALDRRSLFSRALSVPPLVWLGTRSFGLYLWHFPLFQLFKVTNNATSPVMVVLAILLSLLAAELSVRLIERPLAQRRFPLVIGIELAMRDDYTRFLAYIPTALTAIALAVGVAGLIAVPDETAIPEGALQNTGVGAGEAMDLSSGKPNANASNSEDTKKETDAKSSSNTTDDKSKDSKDTKTTASDVNNLPTGSITLESSKEDLAKGLYTPTIIADSVAGDADWYFDEHMPNALLDSYIGRRPDQALSVLQGYLEQGVVGDIVILDSFSNVPATDDTMKSLIEACGDRKVYLVNVRIPEIEQEQINETIARYADMYDNVTLIDWYGYSEGHDGWLYADGEHLTPEGQPEYVDMISNAIAKDFVLAGGTVVGEDGTSTSGATMTTGTSSSTSSSSSSSSSSSTSNSSSASTSSSKGSDKSTSSSTTSSTGNSSKATSASSSS